MALKGAIEVPNSTVAVNRIDHVDCLHDELDAYCWEFEPLKSTCAVFLATTTWQQFFKLATLTHLNDVTISANIKVFSHEVSVLKKSTALIYRFVFFCQF